MKFREKQISNRLKAFIRSRFKMIDVEPKCGLFNFRCFNNVAEYHRINGGTVLEVILLNNTEDPILHYINTNESGECLETTLGYKAAKYEYYLVREIHISDIPNIEAEFARSLESWLHEHSSWFDRNFLGIRRVL